LRVVAFVLFLIFSCYYLGLLFLDFRLAYLPYLFLAFFLSLLTVDFLSGLLHWAADTWGNVSWPVVGKSIIQSFRLHHIDQKGITRHDFIETNGDVAIVALIVQILGIGVLFFFTFHYFFIAYFGFVTIIGQMTNQMHKWAHQDRVPRIITFLQRYDVILSAEHHGLHHKAPHTSYYCITFGWMNPFLTSIRFFPRLEKVITFCTGLQPRDDGVDLALHHKHKKKAKKRL